MIIVVGTPSEDPVTRVLEEADAAGVDVALLDEADAARWALSVSSDDHGVHARATTSLGRIALEDATGMYLRTTARRTSHPGSDPLELRRRDAALALIGSWADVAPIRVANRPRAMASNGSKPYQAALIRSLAFSVPATLVSNDPDEVRAFWRAQGRVIYKSTSGVRSIVHELTPVRAAVLDRVRDLPTQFQELLEGTNVRVHVIGDEVFPVEIDATTLDYRYREGEEASTMTPTEIPDDIAERCRALSRALDLPLAGIDLFRDRAGCWWCFEVNPSPAYSCFEGPTGLPMARALVRWLAADGE